MKLFSIIFISVAFHAFAFGQNDKEYSGKNVKKVTILEQDYDKGKPAGENEIKSVTVFDKKGNIVEEIDYKDGKLHKSVVYDYDDLGNKIKETEKDENGKVVKTIEYKYKDGLKVERVVYDEAHRPKSKKTYQYEKF